MANRLDFFFTCEEFLYTHFFFVFSLLQSYQTHREILSDNMQQLIVNLITISLFLNDLVFLAQFIFNRIVVC